MHMGIIRIHIYTTSSPKSQYTFSHSKSCLVTQIVLVFYVLRFSDTETSAMITILTGEHCIHQKKENALKDLVIMSKVKITSLSVVANPGSRIKQWSAWRYLI